jgi:hypothetical protein
MGENPPIGLEGLRDLFEHLDRTSSTGYECDHTFALTQAFLVKRGFAVEPMIKWLGENGAGCDCEVMMNTAGEWEEAAGYTPPEEDE